MDPGACPRRWPRWRSGPSHASRGRLQARAPPPGPPVRSLCDDSLQGLKSGPEGGRVKDSVLTDIRVWRGDARAEHLSFSPICVPKLYALESANRRTWVHAPHTGIVTIEGEKVLILSKNRRLFD